MSGFTTFLAAGKLTKPRDDDLNTYPDLRTVTIPMTAWPPPRTAPCWCGSGRKYKQCCRRHGLGTLDFGPWIDDIAAMLSDVVGPVNSAKEFSKGKRPDS